MAKKSAKSARQIAKDLLPRLNAADPSVVSLAREIWGVAFPADDPAEAARAVEALVRDLLADAPADDTSAAEAPLEKSVRPDEVAKPETRTFQGLTVKIDRPKGFIQHGNDASGAPWSRTYKVDYGYIPRTEGGDEEALDVFIGPDESAPTAFWIVQCKDDGSFDEFKVMLGYRDRAAARADYIAHVPERYLREIFEVPVVAMQALLEVAPMKKAMGRGTAAPQGDAQVAA